MRLSTAIAAPLLSAVFVACGGDDRVAPAEPAPVDQTEAVHHVHGLGVAPSDGTLYVATHTGLFEAAEGERQLRRISDSQQDIMGFSVLDGERFIGSGHPDPNDASSPPNLGLIESRDAGRSWQNISLLGEADFHVLQSSGDRIYGYDGTQGRLMVSSDGGREWTQRTPPAALFDLAIDPRDPDRIVVASERGIYSSARAGESWRPLREDIAGLLAWPGERRLFLVDGGGEVQVSGDGGRQWRATGNVGGQPVAFLADESGLYAALADSSVKASTDDGVTWTVRATP